MAYLEELLPEFRKGAKIRRKDWSKGSYIYLREGTIYGKDNTPVDYAMDSSWLSCPFWEFYQEPEPDWEYIIKNKCLCWFWDRDSGEVLSRYLKEVDSRKTYPYKDGFGSTWKHCRPVRKNELNFYEDKEDD